MDEEQERKSPGFAIAALASGMTLASKLRFDLPLSWWPEYGIPCSRVNNNGDVRGRSMLYLLVMILLACVFAFLPGTLQGAELDAEFDHDETIFPLDFVHARVNCDACHAQGIFKGTPTRCNGCHSRSGRIQASAPSITHIRTTDDCEFCHQSASWVSVARVDHYAVVGSCQSCHNGFTATGKNPGHVQSSDNCDDCHRTTSWLDAVFDHRDIFGGCFNCHNGVIAEGKNPAHLLSTDTCEDCHGTISWSPVLRVDHNAVRGTCFSCHNGVTAIGKHPQHMQTSNECELCHNTITFTNAQYAHQSANYPGDHGQNLDCISCHTSNDETIIWPSPAFQPDCAACHEADYAPDSHKKYVNPDTNYSVAELRDCTSSCHTYTDNTETVISETRNSEHRVSDLQF